MDELLLDFRDPAPRPVLVLSGTDPRVLALARSVLLNGLPRDAGARLFHVGNPTPFDPQLLPSEGADWLKQNRGRCSLLAPVLETLPGGERVAVVVLGTARVFDRTDWESDPRVAAIHTFPTDTIVTSAEVCRQLQDPVTGVVISGPGTMSVEWDNPDYRLTTVDGPALSRATAPRSSGVRVRVVTSKPDSIRFRATHLSGRESSGPLAPAVNDLPPPSVVRLTSAECAAVEAGIANREFVCPRCGQGKSPRTMTCRVAAERAGQFLPVPVYASIGDQHRGFVRFRSDGTAELVRENVVRLEPDRVAVWQTGAFAEQWTYAPGSGWERTDRGWEQYAPTTGGGHACVVG